MSVDICLICIRADSVSDFITFWPTLSPVQDVGYSNTGFDVAWTVCLVCMSVSGLIKSMRPVKMAEPIKMPFGVPRNNVKMRYISAPPGKYD